MSQQGLQRCQTLLNIVGQQFPAICQAAETHGIDLSEFLYGMFVRCNIQPTAEVWTFIAALNGIIGPATPKPQPAPPPCPQPVDDAVAQS